MDSTGASPSCTPQAVEHLGTDKPPVRLGGLSALKQFVQRDPAHNQIIVATVI